MESKEEYKDRIIEMIQEIDDVDVLSYLEIFIKGKIKAE